jgi:hypothetical protein
MVRIRSRVGAIELPAHITETLRPDCVMVAHGFGHRSRLLSLAAGKGVRDGDVIPSRTVEEFVAAGNFGGAACIMDAVVNIETALSGGLPGAGLAGPTLARTGMTQDLAPWFAFAASALLNTDAGQLSALLEHLRAEASDPASADWIERLAATLPPGSPGSRKRIHSVVSESCGQPMLAVAVRLRGNPAVDGRRP